MLTNLIRYIPFDEGASIGCPRQMLVYNPLPMAVQVVHRGLYEEEGEDDSLPGNACFGDSEYNDVDLANILIDTMLALGLDIQESNYEEVPETVESVLESHDKYQALGVVAKLFVESLTEKDIKKVPALAEFRRTVLEAMPEDVSFYIPTEEEDTENEEEF